MSGRQVCRVVARLSLPFRYLLTDAHTGGSAAAGPVLEYCQGSGLPSRDREIPGVRQGQAQALLRWRSESLCHSKRSLHRWSDARSSLGLLFRIALVMMGGRPPMLRGYGDQREYV